MILDITPEQLGKLKAILDTAKIRETCRGKEANKASLKDIEECMELLDKITKKALN